MIVDGEVRRVSDAILGRIVSGAYPSGLRLPSETDLATEFACARSTVREALRHIASLGVIRSRRGSGAMVLDFRREGTPALLPWYLFTGRFDRPPGVVARELLGIRALLATQAVRLAARYADPGGLGEARTILARGPALEGDRVAHAWNELELFRSLVCASRVWPAVWLANVFWAPMRELHRQLAPTVGSIPEGYQVQMERLLELIEARDEAGAEAHLSAWLVQVDGFLIQELEQVFGEPRQDRALPAAVEGKEGLE